MQKRIYKATKAGRLKQAKALQKLLLRSSCSIVLNVRKVTQDNSGRKTAGIDGAKSLSPKQRKELVKELMSLATAAFKKYRAKPIRRVWIPKANGKLRPLGIPTINDRVVQGVVKTAIEPQFEAIFEPNSYEIRVVKYADDFVVMHENKEAIEDSKIIIAKWLKERGLELSEEKTRITHSNEGFDFLGFNIRHYENETTGYRAKNFANKQGFKILIKPSKKSIKAHSDKIKQILKQMKSAPQDAVIRKLNPIIKGWTNYFRTGVSTDTFNKLDYLMWEKIWTRSKRRHNNKGRKWIANKYFHTIGKRKWRFATKKYGQIDQVLVKYTDTKIQRHVKVRKGKSFYDGDEIYWAKRLSGGYGDISPSKAKMLKSQGGKCAYCSAVFKNGDLLEAHHKTHKANGGMDKYGNLILMHRHCHDQYHAQHLKLRAEKRRLKALEKARSRKRKTNKRYSGYCSSEKGGAEQGHMGGAVCQSGIYVS